MKTERIKARDVEAGDRLVATDGKPIVVNSNKVSRAFKMALKGHPDRYAREIVAGGSLEVMHPDETVERIIA